MLYTYGMKIGLICPYNLHKNGGVQECVLALQERYVKAGHKAIIITPKPQKLSHNVYEDVIYVGTAKDIKSPFHTTAQISVSVDGKELDAILAQQKFDILHFHEPWVPILGRQILSRSSSVNIATFHAKLPETMMTKTIEKVITPYTKSILKYIDAFTAVSPAGAEYVGTLTKKTIKIITNGIDIDKYKGKKYKPSNTILYIGRLERRKGVKYLLEAFRLLKLRDPSARLVIVGDGPEREKLESIIGERQIDDVIFTGFVTDAEKRRLLSQARVFCSPALFGESFGIVLLEAMASGTPIVAGDNSGYRSVLTGRGSLSIIDPKDSYIFSARLELFYRDEQLRGLWSEWASEYIKQFSYDLIAKAYLDLYAHQLKVSKT